jgi:hypothetical protein
MVPIGAAFKIIPRIVAAKIAKRCQASGLTPFGIGINHKMSATRKVMAIFLILISFIISVV